MLYSCSQVLGSDLSETTSYQEYSLQSPSNPGQGQDCEDLTLQINFSQMRKREGLFFPSEQREVLSSHEEVCPGYDP
jgi:hypothetical protein